MKPIFEYLNYREYLRDFYEEKKRTCSYYSFRLFSQKAGFKAPNMLKLVMDGARNLTKESVFKFVKALGLNKREAEYFEHLVFFCQAASLEEKNAYLQQCMKIRGYADPRRIEQAEYEYYSAWWHPVVRELVTSPGFTDNFDALGAAVCPAISASEAKKSVELLERIGFITRGPDGGWAQADATLTTGPRVRSIAVANYHHDMIKLASESIERFGADERDITSLTLHVSEELRAVITERLRQVRRELLAAAEAEQSPSRVVQVNFQLFPLSAKAQPPKGNP